MSVTVRLAGPLRVEQGSPPEPLRIGSPKERRLLAVLAARRPQAVTPDRLAEALWPEGPPRSPSANVATLISRLRGRLGNAAVLGDRQGYRLGEPPDVGVDLDEATDLVARAARHLAAGASGPATVAARRALELVDAEPLAEEDDAPWVVDLRRRWSELRRAAHHHAAEAALATGDTTAARTLAAAALTADPYDEPAMRLLLTADQAAGEPARAVLAFHEFRARLADELGVEPAPATRDAYLAVLHEAPAAPGRPVSGHAGGPGRTPPARASAMVGRDKEIARLIGHWDRAGSGEPGIVLVVGEAGIGKTRLTTELQHVAVGSGARVAVGRCHVAERSLFLQPMIDALAAPLAGLPLEVIRGAAGHHCRALAGLFPDLADALGVDDPEASVPDARRSFEAIGGLLRALTVDRSMLLVLDDLHNAGTATVELLHHLALRSGSARLLVVATVRIEEGSDSLVTLERAASRLDLGRLSPADVAVLADRAGQTDRGAAIERRTRGNPFFVVEVLRALASGDHDVPESLQAAVVARVRRLGDTVEELLRAGSVLGATVDPTVVGRLLGLDPVEAARRCEQAAAARLLVPTDRAYEFANDLIHEVLYATTPTPTRRLHHRRAADLLTATPEAVGVHALAVEDWSRAARAFLLAGRSATRRGGVGDAEALLGQALHAADRAGSRELVGRVLVARARAREGLEHFAEAWADLDAAAVAARQAGDRRLEMAALRELGGDVPVALGRPVGESTERLRQGLRHALDYGDAGAEADFRARLAVLATNRLAFVEALDEGARAVGAARAAGDEEALVAGLDGLKTAHAYLGHIAQLTEVVHQMEPLVRRRDDRWYLPWALFEGSFGAIADGRWDDARERIGEAVEESGRSGYPGHATWFVAHLGWVARLQGDLDAAVEHGRRAVEIGGRAAHLWWWPTAGAMLAATLLELGQPREARRVAAEAVSAAGTDAIAACRLRCLAPLAEAEARDAPGGPVPPTLIEADRLLAAVDAPVGSAWLLGADAYLGVARAWRAIGRPDRADAALAPLAVAAQRHGWRTVLAAASLEGCAPTAATVAQ
ncbi:AAA family ATPase [Actinomycetospora endophytica]|uniref:AAA family ATPase n=1 Tax=Actinomycetospora endophytica TaxID=2291215 RepID=A0ABS8PAL8_9PSEU|nr:AAA family ATPase [Actinomycetospora endophytica]MCD2195169.1 AAA family ATPase [Actinomycetospora endophytica]